MRYSFRAVDRSGKPVTGEREAGSERELADQLRRENLVLLETTASEVVVRRRWWESLPNPLGRVSLVDRMVFARNLAVMIGAGLALARALEALAEQTTNGRFRVIISATRDGIVKGKSFAESLKPHEGVFGVLFINMVEAGEISGNLERVLKILAIQMKRDYDLRAKVRGAMIYPAIVVGALLAIGILMMVYVVPVLTQTFAELEIQLPLTTRIIIGASNILVGYAWYLLAAGVLAALGLTRLARLAPVRRWLDAAILRVPLFGDLVVKLNSARFSRMLSSLIRSGIPITRALETTASVLGNVHFREALHAAAGAIQKGTSLHEILHGYPKLFPPMTVHMVEVGEETGTVARMLLRVALFYEEEVDNTTKNLSNVIEPLLMIVIGGMVGLFAVSMIQPIYSGLGNL